MGPEGCQDGSQEVPRGPRGCSGRLLRESSHQILRLALLKLCIYVYIILYSRLYIIHMVEMEVFNLYIYIYIYISTIHEPTTMDKTIGGVIVLSYEVL